MMTEIVWALLLWGNFVVGLFVGYKIGKDMPK